MIGKYANCSITVNLNVITTYQKSSKYIYIYSQFTICLKEETRRAMIIYQWFSLNVRICDRLPYRATFVVENG